MSKQIKERTIMIFPEFKNLGLINEIRKEYDPLADLVLPHITLVFPFRSIISSEELMEWMRISLNNIKPFDLKLGGFTKEKNFYGNYLFLNVLNGREEIEIIHYAMYDGILKQFHADKLYEPHMTVGKFNNQEELEEAYKKLEKFDSIFETSIDKISVEIIGMRQESIIECEYKLT